CARALQSLASMEVERQALVDTAAAACNGSAVVGSNGRVYASSGAADTLHLPKGRNSEGTLLTMPLRSGLTLYALVGDRSQDAQRTGFAGEILAFTLLAVLMTAALALVAARAITTPLRGLLDSAEAVAEGDLTRGVPVLSADEIGSLASSFGEMNARLRLLVRDISEAAQSLTREVSTVASAGVRVQRSMEIRREGVAVATREMTDMDHSVASVGRDVALLADYVSATSAALAEFATALDEVRRQGGALDGAVKDARGEVQALMKAAERTRTEFAELAEAASSTLSTAAQARETLRSLADAAEESERVAERVFSETESGKRIVEEGVRGVEAVRGVVAEARARVLTLGERSADITAIVDFIADVAGRTNLLSLNAAIIAAQAGEQGKAFGVVAEHIRDLATQIGSSTKRIGDIIAGVRVEVDATSELIQRSDELASVGLERARESWQALSRIAESTRRSREVTSSILPAVSAHVESSQQIEALASQVVELARGFAGVDLLIRGGRSIDQIAQSLAPLTQRVGRALDEQALVSRKQMENLDEINRMIGRLNETVQQHGEGTARVLRNLSELMEAADGDRQAASQLASSARVLERHAQALREGLARFRV
ncbi:MAG: methyl-accepting chemotaxis protein, partial [Myxococcales bacterium]